MRGTLKIAAACLILAAMVASAQAQYSIDWYTIDGGGGTSTGGVYSVSGTIGQPDAGAMSGGPYTLQGGFWGIYAAVQTPDSPLLTVQLTATNTIRIAWEHPSTGFNLEQNPVATGGTWSSVTNIPTQVGTQWQIIITPPTGNRFYRLTK
jgi:hypothetical protein